MNEWTICWHLQVYHGKHPRLSMAECFWRYRTEAALVSGCSVYTYHPCWRLFSPGHLSAIYHDKVLFLYTALLLFWKPNPHKYWNNTRICISPLSMVIESLLCAITENKNNICGCQTLPAQEVISEQIIFYDSFYNKGGTIIIQTHPFTFYRNEEVAIMMSCD